MGCIGSSESTLVKFPHCWKSHATAHLIFSAEIILSLNTLLLFFFYSVIFNLFLFFFYFQTLPSSFQTGMGPNSGDTVTYIFRLHCTSCIRAAKALASLRIRTDSPEPSLLAEAISTEISCTGIYCTTIDLC